MVSYAVILAVSLAAWIIGRRLLTWLVDYLTAINDLKRLNYSIPRQLPKIGGTAVVCGGSVGGIVMAAVLSHHFERVVVVEPDFVPILKEAAPGGSAANPRTRIRQYLQPHGFLQFSLLLYRKLFVGFDTEARKIGAVIVPWISDFAVGGQSIKINKVDNSLTSISISRDGLEPLLRRLLVTDGKYTNVTWLRGTVTGLLLSPTSQSKVTDVTVRPHEGSEITQSAAFVVDASGPSAIGIKFLARLPRPICVGRTLYNPGQMYRSVILPVSKKTQKVLEEGGYIKALGSSASTWLNTGFVGISAANFKAGQRFGYSLASYDGERVLLCVTHATNDSDPETLPKTVTDLIEIWRTLLIPPAILAIGEKIVEACLEEFSPEELVLTKMDLGKSHWNDYGAASASKDFPGNFIAIGDAFAKVNPAFGTGCTKANVDAVTLDGCLKNLTSIPNAFARQFFAKQAPRLSFSWLMIKSLDYGEPCHQPSGEDTWAQLNLWYPMVRSSWGTTLIAATKDEYVGESLLRVMNMVDSPLALCTPKALYRTLAALLK